MLLLHLLLRVVASKVAAITWRTIAGVGIAQALWVVGGWPIMARCILVYLIKINFTISHSHLLCRAILYLRVLIVYPFILFWLRKAILLNRCELTFVYSIAILCIVHLLGSRVLKVLVDSVFLEAMFTLWLKLINIGPSLILRSRRNEGGPLSEDGSCSTYLIYLTTSQGSLLPSMFVERAVQIHSFPLRHATLLTVIINRWIFNLHFHPVASVTEGLTIVVA